MCVMHTRCLQNTFRCVCNTYVFFLWNRFRCVFRCLCNACMEDVCGMGLDVCAMHVRCFSMGLDVCAVYGRCLRNEFRCVCDAFEMFVEWV
jgi:hypothetical protein